MSVHIITFDDALAFDSLDSTMLNWSLYLYVQVRIEDDIAVTATGM